jgi:hypothetical protein
VIPRLRIGTVITARYLAPNKYAVRVSDAIGSSRWDRCKSWVLPKIPLTHLHYLFSRSGRFPRVDFGKAGLSPGDSFWTVIVNLVCHSHRDSSCGVLFAHYRRTTSDLRAARGQLVPFPTAQAFLRWTLLTSLLIPMTSVLTPPLNESSERQPPRWRRVASWSGRFVVVLSPLVDRLVDATELQAGDIEMVWTVRPATMTTRGVLPSTFWQARAGPWHMGRRRRDLSGTYSRDG